jgi:hypothetical protein
MIMVTVKWPKHVAAIYECYIKLCINRLLITYYHLVIKCLSSFLKFIADSLQTRADSNLSCNGTKCHK